MSEVKKKLEAFRSLMASQGISGVRLKGVDWFSWATAGGSSVVIFTNEIGVAEVFITMEHAWVLTDRIEKDRLANEEIPPDFEIVSFPWEDKEFTSKFIHGHLKGNICYSDKPSGSEKLLPYEFQSLKMVLLPEEIKRYRNLARSAAEAMTEALTKAEPGWTEQQLAGEGAKALWSRGMDPTLVLVGSERRVQIYRHPIARAEKLGDYAMMVFCARQYGLYANLTRFIFFREPTPKEKRNFELVAEVEAAALEMSVGGTPLASVYETLSEAYSRIGLPEEVHRHHQGGPTGYLSREQVASPQSPLYQILQPGMAVAWNPSLPGAKIEDTVLITENGLEILTVDPKWPTFQIAARPRPDLWIRK